MGAETLMQDARVLMALFPHYDVVLAMWDAAQDRRGRSDRAAYRDARRAFAAAAGIPSEMPGHIRAWQREHGRGRAQAAMVKAITALKETSDA